MADAGAGRHDAEIVERLLAPAQELVALAVALVFELDVLLEAERRAEAVDHHRVVDDEIDRHQRIDLLRIGAERRRRVAHRGEIDHGGDAGEILHQHARRAVGNLVLGLCESFSQSAIARMSSLGDGAPVLEAQQVLQHHLHRVRQARNARQAVLLGLGEGEIDVGLAPTVRVDLDLKLSREWVTAAAC